MADLDQAALRHVYDALLEEYEKRSTPWTGSRTYEAGYLLGINEAINIVVRLNDGYAPAQHKSADGKDGNG